MSTTWENLKLSGNLCLHGKVREFDWKSEKFLTFSKISFSYYNKECYWFEFWVELQSIYSSDIFKIISKSTKAFSKKIFTLLEYAIKIPCSI